MDELTQRLRREAQRIASRHGLPRFYLQFKAPLALARKIYFNHPLMKFARRQIRSRLQEHLGHGLYHSMRVSIDSATLIYVEIESNHLDSAQAQRLMLLGQLAGLMHDICREQQNHAVMGAREAERILINYPLAEEEQRCICCAIENHEAFTPAIACNPPWSQVVSDCLYDADKFRWGPDNFTHTLWHMVAHQHLSTRELIERFPWGMSGLTRIQETFRSSAGRTYGPEIIDTGIEIGKEIYRYLLQNFGGE
jgi:hypothetical protein